MVRELWNATAEQEPPEGEPPADPELDEADPGELTAPT